MNFGKFDGPSNKPVPIITKQIVIVDASTHDLGTAAINPKVIVGQVTPKLLPVEFKYDLCGPTSEANDVLARDYPLTEELKAAESILAITDAGAYAMSLGGNYASRCRPAEVLVCCILSVISNIQVHQNVSYIQLLYVLVRLERNI